MTGWSDKAVTEFRETVSILNTMGKISKQSLENCKLELSPSEMENTIIYELEIREDEV